MSSSRSYSETGRRSERSGGLIGAGLLAVAMLSPLAYVLVLTALATSPVSYVAPVRESSILIGVFLGAKLLGEQGTVYRFPAAVGVVLGVVALAIG